MNPLQNPVFHTEFARQDHLRMLAEAEKSRTIHRLFSKPKKVDARRSWTPVLRRKLYYALAITILVALLAVQFAVAAISYGAGGHGHYWAY